MKASSATSAKAAKGRPRLTVQSSERRSHTRADGIALSGPSNLPDPAFNAYRPDLADCALAHQVIASHYALPLERVVTKRATLRQRPSDEAEPLSELEPGEPFSMLDNSLGWAWGYAGEARLVGYVRAEALEV